MAYSNQPQAQFNSVHLGPQPNEDETKLPLVPSFSETLQLTKTNSGWKLHVLIAGIAVASSWSVWFMIDWFAPHFPWFIWVWGACLMSLALHYYLFVRKKQYYHLHLAWFTIVNMNLMLTWLCTETDYMWWLIVALVWGHFLNVHYQLTENKASKDKFIKLHQVSFVLLQVMLFFIWVQTDRKFPWFLITFFSLAALYLAHHSYHYYPGDWMKLHTYIFADIQVLLFVVWAATGPSIPWFIFPLLAWGILLIVHFKFFHKKQESLLPQQNVAPSTSNFNYNYSYQSPVPPSDSSYNFPSSGYGSMYPSVVEQPPVYVVPVTAAPQENSQPQEVRENM